MLEVRRQLVSIGREIEVSLLSSKPIILAGILDGVPDAV
jgi:hypothetical protein